MARIANVLEEIAAVSSTTSHSFTFSGAASSGHTLIGTIILDGASGILPTLTITDNRGNTWAVDASVVSGLTVCTYIIRSTLTTAIQAGDTLQVTASTVRIRWLCSIEEFDDVLTSPLDKTATNPGTSSSSLTSTATAATASAPQLVFGSFGYGVGRVFTPGAQFTAGTTLETAAGTNDRALTHEWRWLQSIGTPAATATLSSNSTYAAAVATYVSNMANVAPVANAGSDQTVAAGASVALNGSGSDSDGTIASYQWAQTSGTAVSLSSSSVAAPTFTAPTLPGGDTLVFSLTVTDDAGQVSASDSVTINVQAEQQGDPAGWIGTVAAGTRSTSGTSLVLTLTSNVTAGNTLLGGLSVEAASGTVPSLTITDSQGNTWAVDQQIVSGTTIATSIFRTYVTTPLTIGDTITITASVSRSRWAASVENFGSVNVSPVEVSASNADINATLTSGTTATTSAAPRLIFAAFGYGSGRTFTSLNGFTASSQMVTAAGSSDRAHSNEWKYAYAVGTQNATAQLSSSSTYSGAVVAYRALAPLATPRADAGSDQTVLGGQTVTLGGSAVDDDGTITGYAWSQLSGTTVTLSSTSVASPTFTAPAGVVTGVLEFQLTATDNDSQTDSDTVTITVLPANQLILQSGSWNPEVLYICRGGSWV